MFGWQTKKDRGGDRRIQVDRRIIIPDDDTIDAVITHHETQQIETRDQVRAGKARLKQAILELRKIAHD